MRTTSVAFALAGSGCAAALPPPTPPHIAGSIVSSGGALGTWQMTPSRIHSVDDVDALDLVDPASPGHTVRIVVAASEPAQLPKGIEETVAPREVELHIASAASSDGGGSEVVLAHDHCATLDAIMRATHGVAFGSARFDCTLSDGGHVRGDFEFAGGGYGGPRRINGHLEASGDALAHVRFEPDQGSLDPRGAMFWDRRYPRVVFEVDQAPSDASILGRGINATLRVRSTAAAIHSFEVSPHACRVLRFDRKEAGFVRIGRRQHTLWTGTLNVDCETPDGGRLEASLRLDG